MELVEEFQRIKKQHREAQRSRCARTTLGPSVMRVYAKGTRDALSELLPKLDVDVLTHIADQNQYNAWFDLHLKRIAQVIDKHNSRNMRIRPGLKWGHAAKVLALFVRDLVMYSRYFSDSEARRISFFLHAPIDSIVIARLRTLRVQPPFARLKEIDTRNKFYFVQTSLEKAATKHKVPRVWFDDNWGDRQ
jgi:hypothetical protein